LISVSVGDGREPGIHRMTPGEPIPCITLESNHEQRPGDKAGVELVFVQRERGSETAYTMIPPMIRPASMAKARSRASVASLLGSIRPYHSREASIVIAVRYIQWKTNMGRTAVNTVEVGYIGCSSVSLSVR